MYSEKEAEQSLDIWNLIGRFVKIMLRIWYLVLALIVAGSLFFGVRAYRSYTPAYECSVLFSVKSSYAGSDIFTTTYYDNAAAQQLVEAFPSILSTDLMRDLIRQELGKNSINGNISASVVPNTNMLTLTVRSSSAQDSYDILRAAINSFPQVAVYMVDNPQTVVMEEPRVPTHPVNSRDWKRPALKGAVLGAMAACGLGVILTLLTRVITSPDQLKSISNLPILAVLPRVNPKKRRSGRTAALRLDSDPGMEESLRGLGLKLRKMLAGDGNRVILVTSSVSGEGKTTVSVNLARTLAEDGSRVVIVDADLRKQSVAMHFGRQAEGKGLMGCLSGQRLPVMECLENAEENLYYLSGQSVSKSHYGIDTKRLRTIMETLNREFDYVVVDTPPCGMVADTMLLCQTAGIVLYVVRPDGATEPQVVDNVTAMYERKIPIEGFVFNGQPRSRSRYGYGGSYSSRYGYKGYGAKN